MPSRGFFTLFFYLCYHGITSKVELKVWQNKINLAKVGDLVNLKEIHARALFRSTQSQKAFQECEMVSLTTALPLFYVLDLHQIIITLSIIPSVFALSYTFFTTEVANMHLVSPPHIFQLSLNYSFSHFATFLTFEIYSPPPHRFLGSSIFWDGMRMNPNITVCFHFGSSIDCLML